MKSEMLVTDVPTPALLLDADRVERNCARMLARASQMGVTLRPHIVDQWSKVTGWRAGV